MVEIPQIPIDVDSISLRFLNLLGKPCEIRVPKNMMETCINDGISFDSSNLGYTDISRSDMIAIPDVSTMKILRYEKDHIAAFLCDIHQPDGGRFKGDPRYLLKSTLEHYRVKGFTFHVKPEYEFYLLDRETKRPVDTGKYIDGRVDNTKLVGVLTKLLQNYDFGIEKVHHEVGPGQYEIETLPYSEPIKMADDFIIIKELIKKEALNRGILATFMPKPIAYTAGSGFHIHISLFKDGEFRLTTGDLNSYTKGFIGGLLKHAKALSALCLPTINSYKRIIPGYEAPVYISWGSSNRSTLVRIPAYSSSRESKGRIEYRGIDATVNVYLMMNSLICAGMDGIEKGMEPGKEMTENLFDIKDHALEGGLIDHLPTNLNESLVELAKDEVIKESLGEIFEPYVEMKRKEMSAFTKFVTDWELDNYLDY